MQLPRGKNDRSRLGWVSLVHAELRFSYPSDSVCLSNMSTTLFRITSREGYSATLNPQQAILLPEVKYKLRMGSGLEFVLLCSAGGQQTHLPLEMKAEARPAGRKQASERRETDKHYGQTPFAMTPGLPPGWRVIELPRSGALGASESPAESAGPRLQTEIIAVTHLFVVVKKTFGAVTVAQKTLKRQPPKVLSDEIPILRKLDHVTSFKLTAQLPTSSSLM